MLRPSRWFCAPTTRRFRLARNSRLARTLQLVKTSRLARISGLVNFWLPGTPCLVSASWLERISRLIDFWLTRTLRLVRASRLARPFCRLGHRLGNRLFRCSSVYFIPISGWIRGTIWRVFRSIFLLFCLLSLFRLFLLFLFLLFLVGGHRCFLFPVFGFSCFSLLFSDRRHSWIHRRSKAIFRGT